MLPRPPTSPPLRRELELATGRFNLCDWGGDGPLLHLAHANGFCAGSYDPLARRLTAFARVVASDARGHGQTTAAAEPARLTDWQLFADDLAAILTALGGAVIAVGHSLGGVASLMTAAAHPELVRGLVLLDPTIFPRRWRWPLGWAKRFGLGHRFPIAARAAARRASWPSREIVARAFRTKPAFRHWQEEHFSAYLDCAFAVRNDGQLELRCAPAWEAQVFATTPHDVWRLLPHLRCPVLVVYGAASDTFRPSAARGFLRAVPQAEMVAVPDTGHFVPQEKPAEVSAAIERFVARLCAPDTTPSCDDPVLVPKP